MVTAMPFLLALLCLLSPAASQESKNRVDSLRYYYAGKSEFSEVFPRLQGTGYINDRPFFYYDSTNHKAEPLKPWCEAEGMVNWEKETQFQKERENLFMETLGDILDYYNDNNGFHVLQEAFGCELQNNKSSGAFWKLTYDGRNYLTFNTTISAWVALDPAAQNTQEKWNEYANNAKKYLEEECPDTLRKYLSYNPSSLD
ncbi:zinc-alpha-2-glycoprotein isoform X2 [Tupaia chinensis]|uniref:zinc-alpha-2-glycoprotein isoform X1 n=1 Tax=Tupaia chinensis TaxID=246437 RepID=UPI0003C8FD48|nr:zinc-alpha-2-glycoprotein isoform X1 [Tupaia chinensis]XP_006150202.1 zinc-alpha-2-glycoprotein isoform X2 [Tupaia chinensis]